MFTNRRLWWAIVLGSFAPLSAAQEPGARPASQPSATPGSAPASRPASAKADGPLKAGDAAPSFRVKDHTGRARSLEEFRGKRVVLFFYPKADTPG